MSNEHSKEPWSTKKDTFGQPFWLVGYDGSPGDVIARVYEASNARRIVACVNSCRGIPDDELKTVVALGLSARERSTAGMCHNAHKDVPEVAKESLSIAVESFGETGNE